MKLRKLATIFAVGIITFCSIGLINSNKKTKIYAETTLATPLLYNTVEHDVYNTESVGAVTNNVDAIRFLMTKKAGVKENHLDLYFGLKETLNLNDSNTSLDIQVRALKYYSGKTDYDTKIKIYIIDNNGAVAAARYNTAKVTFQNGTTTTVDCSNGGYAYQGFSCVTNSQSKYLEQAIRTYSLTKNNFELYPTYNSSATEVNYSKIERVIVETWSPELNGTFYQYEVMNISSTKNEESTNLFSASTAVEGESRDVGKNEWYFDSIPTAEPYTNEQKRNIPVIVEQVKARDGGITLYNDSNQDSSFWLRSYYQLENGDSDIDNLLTIRDTSKYDHIAFYADTTQCETDVNVEIKVYWADPNAEVADANRYFRAGSASFYYVPDNGEPYYSSITSGSYIEKGFKGYVYLDLSTFLQDGVGGSYLTYEKQQKLAQNIRFIFNCKTDYKLINGMEGVSKLTIKDVKFIEANRSSLEIEKLFTKINLDFEEGTTKEEIVSSLPDAISIGADIKTIKYAQQHSVSSIIENQYIQIEGEWEAGEVDSNGFIELKFIPNADSVVKLHNEYNFENDVSFIMYGYIKRKININNSTSSENSSANSLVSSAPINNSSSESIDISSSENTSINSIISSESSNGSNSTDKPINPNNKNLGYIIGIAIGTVILISEILAIIVIAIRKGGENNEQD